MSLFKCCTRKSSTEYLPLNATKPADGGTFVASSAGVAISPNPQDSAIFYGQQTDSPYNSDDDFVDSEDSQALPTGSDASSSFSSLASSSPTASSVRAKPSHRRRESVSYIGQPPYVARQAFLGIQQAPFESKKFDLFMAGSKVAVLACRQLEACRAPDDPILSARVHNSNLSLTMYDQVARKGQYNSRISFSLKDQKSDFTLSFFATTQVVPKTTKQSEKIRIRPLQPITFTTASNSNWELKGTLPSEIIGQTFNYIKIKESQT